MVLGDVLLAPLGLLALLALVPLAILYLIQPDPERVDLPTLRFLVEEEGTDATNPLLERLRRNLLLLIQALAVVLFALSLATPYVSVASDRAVEETVVVLDASASMATETGGGTRFDRAVERARSELTSTTSVVVAGAEPRVMVRSGTRSEAQRAIESVEVTAAEGGLRAALTQAGAIAGENARVVVVSDFAPADGWRSEVDALRAGGVDVALERVGGGSNAVGIVDRSFAGQNVTLTVRSYAERPVTRTLAFGGRSVQLDLRPGDTVETTFPVPAGGAVARLQPGDGFPTDDVAHVAAPPDPTVDVLVLTNDRNRHLVTALSVIDAVDLRVDSPPTTVDRQYDVIVFSNVREDRLLGSNLNAGRETIERGGGVVVQAQRTMPGYDDLSLVDQTGVGTNPTIGRVASDELTRDISFPPPGEYVTGEVRNGTRTLVATSNGTPLLATARREGGRLLYYGYISESSPFKFTYQYPVFWKRAVFFLADRESLDRLNRRAGDRLTFDAERSVRTPDGNVTARSVRLEDAGFYVAGDRRVGVGLYSATESNVSSPALSSESGTGGVRTETQRVPRPLDWVVALVALAVLVGEVGYLRRRGEI